MVDLTAQKERLDREQRKLQGLQADVEAQKAELEHREPLEGLRKRSKRC